MTLTAHIDEDCRCLSRYFQKLFEVFREALAEDRVAPIEIVDPYASEPQQTFFGISHLIKPDMVVNIYSLVEFWLQKICDHQKHKKQLSLRYKVIKGSNDLHAYHKYLTDYAGLDLSAADTSYKCLDDLRKVRNRLIHNGGHLASGEEKEFSGISGIALAVGTLIVVEESFIWNALDHAKKYLYAAAQA